MLGHKSGQSRDILDNQLKRDDFVTAPHQVICRTSSKSIGRTSPGGQLIQGKVLLAVF